MLSQQISAENPNFENYNLEEKPSTIISEESKIHKKKIYSVVLGDKGINLYKNLIIILFI